MSAASAARGDVGRGAGVYVGVSGAEFEGSSGVYGAAGAAPAVAAGRVAFAFDLAPRRPLRPPRESGFVRAEGFGAVAVAAAGRGVDFCRTAHGGRAASLTAPRRSQVALLRGRARRWTALEAHGTGTPLGDPIEVAAACAVIDRRARSDADELGRVPVTASKAAVGHLEARRAAGLAAALADGAGANAALARLNGRRQRARFGFGDDRARVRRRAGRRGPRGPRRGVDAARGAALAARPDGGGARGPRARAAAASFSALVVGVLRDDAAVLRALPRVEVVRDARDLRESTKNVVVGVGDAGAGGGALVARPSVGPAGVRYAAAIRGRAPGVEAAADADDLAARVQSALARLRRPRAPRARALRWTRARAAFAVVVGSGVSGLAFARALHHYAAVVVLEREAHVGGVWRSQANETSRVNTSEAAYRCHDAGAGDDADHTPACDILANLRRVAATYGTFLFRSPAVACRSAAGDHAVLVGPSRRVVAAALVCVCANRRLGRLRRLAFPSEGAFRGRVAYGAGDDAARVDFRRARVVVVGAGAFATENARTALEGGAARVAVVQRRRGSVCPRIVDYLNFSRPYDGAFAHRAEGNRLVFAAWKGAFAACGVTEPECWRAGRLAPAGHTISVSDVWLVAHACGSLSTALGRVGGVGPDAVTVGAASIPCTVILKCVGFWKNAALRRLLGANGLGANNVVRRGLCYQAEAILDNVGGYQSPSGSSYVEGAQLSILLLTAQLRDAGTVEAAGRRLDVVDARASEGLLGLGTSPGAVAALGPRFLEAARARVLRRCLAFHETALPAAYVAENARDWRALFALCGGAAQAYPFASLLDGLAGEWVDPALALGTAASLGDGAGRRRGSSAGRDRRDGADERRAAPRARRAACPRPAVLRFLSPAADDDGPAVPLSRSTAAIARAVLRFPGGRLVLGLVAAVAAASTHSPRPTSASYGAFLRASFGAATLGRVEASTVDVRQLALLDVAGALGPPRSAGVYVAALGFTRPRGGEALEPNAYSSTGDLLSVAAGRVSHALGLEGPCLALDTACSASLVALAIAAAALGRGTCAEAAVAALSVVEATVSASHAVAGLVSPRGRCHAFDGRADGYCRADGLAAYLLGGDGPDDVSGVEARHDGGSASLAAPNGSSQRRLLRSVDGATIALEAHGTGTALGDPVEVGAAVDALGDTRARPGVADTACSSWLVAAHLALAGGCARAVVAAAGVLRAGASRAYAAAAMLSPARALPRVGRARRRLLPRRSLRRPGARRRPRGVRRAPGRPEREPHGPNGAAQRRLLAAVAGDAAAALEAHGTGTALGDPIEAAAAAAALADGASAASMKAGAGHLEACAAALGLLALRAGGGANAQLRRSNAHLAALGARFRRPVERAASGFAARRLNSFGYSGTIAHAAFDDESRFRVSSRLAAASLFRAARELFPVGDGSSAAICELVGRDPTPLSEGTHLSYERRSFGARIEGRVVVGDLDVASLLFDRSGALLGRLQRSIPLEAAFTVALCTAAALETGVLDRSAADVLAIDAIESRPANAVWIDV
ncbi:hypothetical protein SO694_00091056 [Aureococcus anophagefferens]|uniref:Ketosynthase family 3 (KS3) domain-containing protein n=1 Tax=Aureococcus anophagefferens TaxID=44056 RepID=A0ABR1FS18_AURAN